MQRLTKNKIKPDHESNHERLVVFTRYPEPGTTKTRMIPLLGTKGAARLQQKMTEHLMEQIKALPPSHGLVIEILYQGGDMSMLRDWLGDDYHFTPQYRGELGSRMAHAFKQAFKQGAYAAVIIGTDIPGITSGLIMEAFTLLTHDDLVIGPAKDGGYYLIGLQKNALRDALPLLSSSIAWGTDLVLEQTIKAAGKSGLSFSLLKELEDVDNPEDIHVWEKVSA